MEKIPSSRREGIETMGHWRIAEQFSESRDNERGNEDGCVIAEHCVAVLDGVSARNSKERIYGLTPGQFAVKTASEIMSSPDTNSSNVVARVSRALEHAVGGHSLQHAPSFVFAAFFPKEHVIVRVGDASYLVDGVGHNPGLVVDRAKAVLRKRGLLKLRARGLSEEDLWKDVSTRDRLRELQSWQEHHANKADAKDFGYGVINGKEVPPEFIERIAVPADTKEVVLASDGYPPETLREGLRETEEALRGLQEKDPLAIDGEPGTRPHKPSLGQTATDDRTYVRIVRR